MDLRVREVGEIFQAQDGAYVVVVATPNEAGSCAGCYWNADEGIYPLDRLQTIRVCWDSGKLELTGACASANRKGRGPVKFVKSDLDRNKED